VQLGPPLTARGKESSTATLARRSRRCGGLSLSLRARAPQWLNRIISCAGTHTAGGKHDEPRRSDAKSKADSSVGREHIGAVAHGLAACGASTLELFQRPLKLAWPLKLACVSVRGNSTATPSSYPTDRQLPSPRLLKAEIIIICNMNTGVCSPSSRMHEGVAPIYITSLARFVVSSPAFGSSYLLPLFLSVLSYLQSFVLPAAVLVGVIADSLLYTTYQVSPLLRLENHPVHQITQMRRRHLLHRQTCIRGASLLDC
jgi:hypothetical protein